MSTGLPFADLATWPDSAANSTTAPPAEPEISDLAPFARYEWMPVAIGIMAAGGAYPLLVSATSIVVFAIQMLWSTVTPNAVEPLSLIPLTMLYAIMLAFVGICWSGIATLVVMPIFYLFVKSLKWRADFVTLGAICGGLVGFLSVLPFMLFPLVAARGEMQVAALLLVFTMGPAATTVLGQLGGAWGAQRSDRLKDEADVLSPASEREAHPYIQFSLRHMIWITAWVCLLLTLIHLSQFPFEFILPMLAGWLVFQTGTLTAGRFYFTRIHPRLRLPRLHRANRST
jgi:hypothetical protein